MYYPDEIIDEVRSRNDIVDIISGYVQLKKRGNNYVGLCPFHNEKTGSFSVNQNGQFYHCFGCGKGGNVITFVREYENYSFVEAVKFLADKAGIKLPEVEYSEEMKQKASRKQQLMEINKEAAKYFYYQLRSNPGKLGLDYFRKRELDDETMKNFGLGYSLQYTDDLYKYLRSKDYSDKILIDSGLFNFNERYGMSDRFINRVMFPITDINHKVIAFGGRVLGAGEPKYLNSPETDIFSKSNNLYALDKARMSRKDQIILCEGYMDVIAMHKAGFTQAAASLGTAFTSGHAVLIRRYTKNVLLAYDSDGAGVKAALRNIGILREAGLGCKVINLEPYKDPDEFIKNLGAEEFQKRIDEAENGFMFEVRKAKEQYNLQDPDELTRYHNEVAKKLLVFSEDMERDNYLDAVCRTFSIPKDSMKKLVYKHSQNIVTTDAASSPVVLRSGTKKMTAEDGIKKSQRLLLTYLIEDNLLYNKVKEYISVDDFVDELYKKVAGLMFQGLENNNLNPAAIIDSFEDVEEQRCVAEIFNTKLEAIETEEESEKALKDVVIAVKSGSIAYYTGAPNKDITIVNQLLKSKKELEILKTKAKL